MPRFIPCRVSHLAQELARAVPPGEQAGFWELVRVSEGLYHHYAGAQARIVEELYVPFDPDLATVPVVGPEHEDPMGRLSRRLEGLFDRANFGRAEETQLLTEADREVLTELALDPDLDALEHLAVYHRGLGTKAVTIRRFSKLFRLEERHLPTFRRVAIVVRTQAEPQLQLKLFKDVPCEDLQLLLPTVRVKMKLLDKLKLSGSGSAAAISAWKLIRLAYKFTPTLAKLVAVPFKILLLPLMLLVGGIYGGKTILDYSKIRASYVTAMAEHLYAITMASNRSLVARVATMAGEEDTKEVLLAYAFLLQAERPGIPPEQLRAQVEAFVWDRYRAKIRFDVEDALDKLRELELVWEEEGLLNAVPIDAALRKLDRAWDELYSAPGRAEARARARRETGRQRA